MQRACGLDDGAGVFQALHAVDCPLHCRVQVLHAKADPVETQFAQQAHGCPVRFARVDLDAVVAGIILQQREMRAQPGHQATQFIMAEEGRCAAAQVQLLDHLTGRQMAGKHPDFVFKPLQVSLCPAAILGDHFVAGTVVANICAERDVHVQRQWA
ncbi:hypothetical protein ALP75_203803 [Pseudomonas syringae pv. actinidiae]|nr:hypothetical protein ALP75_203803 [Pseudomonas syringae pv. actinidiae]